MATFTALYKMRIFNFEDVMREMKLSHAGTSTAISRWQSQKVLKPIRRNMYVTIDPSTDAPMCDKFELSSKISESSYVGWHTALELHGVAHQPFYNAYVGSKSRFKDFAFEGISLLDEPKLEKYLALYNKAFLYQKVGFILEYSKEHHHISDQFIEMCRSKGALHTKRLTSTGDSDTYLCRWKLYVPEDCVIEKKNLSV